MSIYKGAMGPGSEVTFFLAATSDSTLSIPNQSKTFSISVIALFDQKMANIAESPPSCSSFWRQMALVTSVTSFVGLANTLEDLFM